MNGCTYFRRTTRGHVLAWVYRRSLANGDDGNSRRYGRRNRRTYESSRTATSRTVRRTFEYERHDQRCTAQSPSPPPSPPANRSSSSSIATFCLYSDTATGYSKLHRFTNTYLYNTTGPSFSRSLCLMSNSTHSRMHIPY